MIRFEENSKNRLHELELELEEVKQKHRVKNESLKEQ